MVLGETGDLFRFFDATAQAEFLGSAVAETVRTTLPREIEYLRGHDLAKADIQMFLEMPGHRLDLMFGFLRRGQGRFSKRAREREFASLTDDEAAAIEGIYAEHLLGRG